MKEWLFLEILLNFSVFINSMIFQMILHVLLTPTNFCFHDTVITSLPGVLGIKWSPLNIGIAFTEMSSKMECCLFPNLGIVRNMTPTDVFLYSIPKKAYALRHIDGKKTRPCLVMSPYLIKAMKKFYVFNNIIYQKYEPTQRSIYSFVCYQFAIYFYVGSIHEESTKDMEEKKLWPLTMDHSGDNEDSISFFIFSYLQWNMVTTRFTSTMYFIIDLHASLI